MLCIIYSMCLFFTAFYRAIFLKSIQLHCEMVVCAAQERKKKKKKSPTERNASCKDKKGNRTKCIGDTEPTKEPNPQPTAADQFISPHNACKFYNTGQIETKQSRLVNCMLVYFFDFFSIHLSCFPRSLHARQNKRQCLLWTERNYF